MMKIEEYETEMKRRGRFWKKKKYDFRAESTFWPVKVVHLEEPGAICKVQLSSKQNRSLLPNYSCFHFIPTVFHSKITSLSYMSVEEKRPVDYSYPTFVVVKFVHLIWVSNSTFCYLFPHALIRKDVHILLFRSHFRDQPWNEASHGRQMASDGRKFNRNHLIGFW